MREVAEAPLLPEGRRNRRLESGPVRLLIDVLDRFEPKSQERKLTFAEDALAVFTLRLLVPEDSEEIAECVENFLDPRFRYKRTLGHWYLYTKHLAIHFAQGD